ncbi:hypothetical protein ABZ896_26975, partial [Streptomyces sp. NPDC047072]
MTVRLVLLCAAASTEHSVRFGDDPLDERAVREARATAGTLERATVVYTAPSMRCTQTAEALGLMPRALVGGGVHDLGAQIVVGGLERLAQRGVG